MNNKYTWSTIKQSFKTAKRLFEFTKGCRPLYITGMLLAASIGLTETVFYGFAMYQILDKAITGDFDGILSSGILLLSIGVFLVILYTVGAWMLDCGVVKISSKARQMIFKHVIYTPAKWFDEHHSGDFMTRMMTDINQMQNALNYPTQKVISLVVTGIVSVVVIFIFDYVIAITLLFVSGLAMLFTMKYIVPAREASEEVLVQTSKITESFSDIIGSGQLLRVHSLSDFVIGIFRKKTNRAKMFVRKQGKIIATQEALSMTITLMVYVTVIAISILNSRNGMFNVAKMVAVLQLSSGPVNMFVYMSSWLVELQNALVCTDRVFEIFDEPIDYDGVEIIPCDDSLAIEINNLSFGYVDDNLILDNISLNIKCNEKIAITGESGCGKSTLLKLICRLYNAKGNIMIFGNDLTKLSRASIGKTLSYVPQEPYIFLGTIMQNISIAKEDATIEEIKEAAIKTGAHEFISKLPDGYNHVLKERGNNLSGGEKLQLALARAMIQDPSILLLDEPTSALDMHSETKIVDALNNINGLTLIIVTHRESLLNCVDRVIQI